MYWRDAYALQHRAWRPNNHTSSHQISSASNSEPDPDGYLFTQGKHRPSYYVFLYARFILGSERFRGYLANKKPRGALRGL
jgi:hypothetical protein